MMPNGSSPDEDRIMKFSSNTGRRGGGLSEEAETRGKKNHNTNKSTRPCGDTKINTHGQTDNSRTNICTRQIQQNTTCARMRAYTQTRLTTEGKTKVLDAIEEGRMGWVGVRVRLKDETKTR